MLLWFDSITKLAQKNLQGKEREKREKSVSKRRNVANRLSVYIKLTENITAEGFRYPFDDLVWLLLVTVF